MVSIKRGIYYLINNRSLFCDSIVKNFLFFLPDKLYISLRYRFQMGKWINWDNPETFTEKIQWLKIYNRKPEYATLVDKYEVKKYVSDKIGNEYIIPTLGVWDKPEDIDWDMLPDQFVLKTTHGGGGGGVVLCKDKHNFDRQKAISKLNESLKSDIYRNLREWPYKNVKRRIIAEKFIASVKETNKLEYDELKDYKFFCFNGKVKFFKVDFGRFVEHHANYYSIDGNLLEFGECGLEPVPEYPIILPSNLIQMVKLAEKLSSDQIFLRVDFYNVNGQIYFGELTFYPASGMLPWTPKIWNNIIGEMLKLPINNKK